jgi:predicted TIM-barrel fold metal-dependent hydrolase
MFTVETATHALRLMTSGLFDRFPQLKIILGHLGETLTFNMWRIEHRISCMGDPRPFKRPLGHYLPTNFYVTTSGNFHAPALANALTELGADHILFSTDYPYESMREAADWFDNVDISEPDRSRSARPTPASFSATCRSRSAASQAPRTPDTHRVGSRHSSDRGTPGAGR